MASTWIILWGAANLFAQFVEAKDGALERYAWYIQLAYKFNLDRECYNYHRKFFYAIEPVIRYGKLSVDLGPRVHCPLIRDREEFTVAFIIYVYKLITLNTEYTIDRIEYNAGNSEDYSEFVAQIGSPVLKNLGIHNYIMSNITKTRNNLIKIIKRHYRDCT